jgi:hypothetical protein
MYTWPSLHAAIIADAESVRAREHTDTIDIVDNVRYHMTARSIDEAHERLALVDELLDMLQLDA